MNAHELSKLISTVDDIDFEDLEPFEVETVAALFTPTLVEEIGDALRELQARRAHAGDEHGIEVPS